MNLRYTKHFYRSFSRLSEETKNKFRKQEKFLLIEIRYPSLHAKKFDETQGIWQARVDDDFRFYFQIVGDIYLILDIRRHPK